MTGAAGSGTHYIASYLGAVAAFKGLSVRHESPKDRPDVLVSWAARCPHAGGESSPKIRYDRLGFGPKSLKPGMVKWAEEQIKGQCLYKHLVHVGESEVPPDHFKVIVKIVLNSLPTARHHSHPL